MIYSLNTWIRIQLEINSERRLLKERTREYFKMVWMDLHSHIHLPQNICTHSIHTHTLHTNTSYIPQTCIHIPHTHACMRQHTHSIHSIHAYIYCTHAYTIYTTYTPTCIQTWYTIAVFTTYIINTHACTYPIKQLHTIIHNTHIYKIHSIHMYTQYRHMCKHTHSKVSYTL